MALSNEIQTLIDKDKIKDVIYNNARGLNRMDLELLLSTYHEDAWDYHGTTDAPAKTFAANAMVSAASDQLSSHLLGQSIISVDDDNATAETYFLTQALKVDGATNLPFDGTGPHLVLSSGRYVDNFEKREGSWKIAKRKVLLDYIHINQLDNKNIDMKHFHQPKKSREDDSYFGR